MKFPKKGEYRHLIDQIKAINAYKCGNSEEILASTQAELLSKCKKTIIRINSLLESIEDNLTARVCQMRLIEGKNWQQMANEIGGGNNAESLRRRYYRAWEKLSRSAQPL